MFAPIDIPIIDVSFLKTDAYDLKSKVATQIHEVSRSHGFFYASGHGVDLDKFRSVTTKFHQVLTQDEKWRIAIKAYNNQNSHFRSGYYMSIPGQKAVESYCYLNPSFTPDHNAIKANLPLHEVNIWPNISIPRLQKFYENHYWEMFDLAALLLKGYALALGQGENYFESYFKKNDTLSSVSLIRYPYLEKYPPVKKGLDGRELGFEDHLDVSLITILCQTSIDNLQVEYEGEWRDIPASKNHLLINAGTYMPYITHGYFHAPNHRVKHINAERLSLPYFVNLGNDSTIIPFFPFGTKDRIENVPISYGAFLNQGLHDLIEKNGQT